MNNVSAAYRVQARNLSQASENKIHEDETARRYGFRGGLVPGVEVYAYMTHLPVARWGIEWLERGVAECRFQKPVYDGSFVAVRGSATAGTLSIVLESEGEQCATGTATLPDQPPAALPTPLAATIPELYDRPDADEATLAIGRRLSSRALHLEPEQLERYLSDVGETAPLYARDKLVHPALMLRLANFVLKDNVKLGAWIHAASSIRHCGLAHAGESLTAHAEVAANYERKGHRFVDLDVVIVTRGMRPLAQVRHTAIYRVRQAE